MGSLVFRWSYADNFGVLARGANCTNVHLARFMSGIKKKPVSMFTTYPLPAEVQMFSNFTYHQPNRIAVKQANGEYASAQSRCGRAMELVIGHESFLALNNRGALSILDASISENTLVCSRVPGFFLKVPQGV